MFTTLIRLLQPAPGLAHTAPAAVEPEPADEPSPCCGWFDSSHELHSGLLVTEHLSADAVASELPLGDWLALHLHGWREPRAA